MLKRATVLAIAVLSLAACGGGGGGSTGPYGGGTGGNNNNNSGGSTGNQVSVTNNKFTPSATTVAVGTTVTWDWNTCTNDPYGGGQTCVTHNVTFDDGTTSGNKNDGTYSRTFNTAGTYDYHCTIHGLAMAGSVKAQ